MRSLDSISPSSGSQSPPVSVPVAVKSCAPSEVPAWRSVRVCSYAASNRNGPGDAFHMTRSRWTSDAPADPSRLSATCVTTFR